MSKQYGHWRVKNMAMLKEAYPRFYKFHMAVENLPRKLRASLYLFKRRATLPKPFWKRLVISIDQDFNVWLSPILNQFLPLGGSRFGYEDETLSSVFAKNAQHARWCCVMCKLLNFLEPDHCNKSIERDEGEEHY